MPKKTTLSKAEIKLKAEAVAARVYMWCESDASNEDGYPTQEMFDNRVAVMHRLCRYISQL